VEAHSISAGLDYPGVGPELSYLRDVGRIEVLTATDEEALQGFGALARSEGILCALESAHAIAAVPRLPAQLVASSDAAIVVNLSGRGDKDLATIVKAIGRAR
jgi:tryptophan synthase beta chain